MVVIKPITSFFPAQSVVKKVKQDVFCRNGRSKMRTVINLKRIKTRKKDWLFRARAKSIKLETSIVS